MKSEDIKEIAVALAQADLPNPKKTHTANAGSYRYSYAPLSEVVDAVRKPLATAGLSYTQIVQQHEATGITLVTMLMHKSGQWICSQYPLPKGLNSQDMGKAITYARRYSLCAILGIAAEDDDDGAGAVAGEQAIKDAEEDQKREEGRRRIEEMKAQGRMKSAHTGETLKPGEEVGPGGETVRAPEAEQAPRTPPKPDPAKVLNDVPRELRQLMIQAGISADQLRAFSVAARHFPAPGIEPAKYPADYVEKLIQPANWAKVVEHIKKGTGK